MTSEPTLALHPANLSDLPQINQVIALAVMQWDLPERVKRLSLPSYQYHEQDLRHLQITLAEYQTGHPIGIAAWEEADQADLPAGKRGLLLHGIYVHPAYQHRGIGSRLLDAARLAASETGLDGVLVKAQAEARGFFLACGMESLAVVDTARDYPYRYWLAV